MIMDYVESTEITGLAKLYYQDNRQVMKKIPDSSIDLILTDPPYNISKYSSGNIDLPNVRYSWGISRILNQNSVNSEFVKGRPKTSRSSFCLFFVYSCFNFQMNTITRQSAVWLLFNTIDYK